MFGRLRRGKSQQDALAEGYFRARCGEGQLASWEVHRLAVYNAERARGILHTPEWQEEMSQLQRRYDGSAQ